MKAFVNIITSNKLQSLLLVLLLAVSNVAFSAHVSSHAPSDSGLCSLCIHPGGPDTAIAQEPRPLFARSAVLNFTLDPAPACLMPVSLHVHHSRAPPDLA